MRKVGLIVVLLAAAGPAAGLLAQIPSGARFTAFWSAPNPTAAAAAVEAIVAAGVSFDEALAQLKRGRVYSADAPRGIVRLDHEAAGRRFPYTVEVPESYDPAKKYQVRIHLHGGVGRPEPRAAGSIGTLAGVEQIYVMPYEPQPNGVHNTAWWPDVKDAFERFVQDHPRDPHPARLTWEAETTDRAHWLIVEQLRARGAEDPLPDLNERVSGTSPNFGVRTAGTRVTAVLKGSNAERLGFLPGDVVQSINARMIPEGVPLLDLLETHDAGTRLTFAVRRGAMVVQLSGIYQPERMPNTTTLFPRPRGSGRVDLVRAGNTVHATTRGVAAFALLLSPDVFDFSQPLTVVADGRTVFSGRVQKDLATLMRWAARDNDRTMLYGAELHIPIR